jgi:hypothetical protein
LRRTNPKSHQTRSADILELLTELRTVKVTDRDIDQKSEEAEVAADAAFEKKFEDFKKSRAAEEKKEADKVKAEEEAKKLIPTPASPAAGGGSRPLPLSLENSKVDPSAIGLNLV